MKIETGEIFVLIKATVGALKLEESMKEVAQPRPTRPPPWRDKFRHEGESVDANEKKTDGNKGPDK